MLKLTPTANLLAKPAPEQDAHVAVGNGTGPATPGGALGATPPVDKSKQLVFKVGYNH